MQGASLAVKAFWLPCFFFLGKGRISSKDVKYGGLRLESTPWICPVHLEINQFLSIQCSTHNRGECAFSSISLTKRVELMPRKKLSLHNLYVTHRELYNHHDSCGKLMSLKSTTDKGCSHHSPTGSVTLTHTF